MGGDREAYAELVRRHHPRLIRLCASFLSETALAEDAAQEVFLKAYRELRHYRGESSFSTWLYRIASRHCTDVIRSQARRATVPLDDASPSIALSADQVLENGETLDRLMNSLPPESRTVLILYEVEGLSYEEIAQVLESSIDAIKSRLKRARQTLLEKTRSL